jgi:hypothetical protein
MKQYKNTVKSTTHITKITTHYKTLTYTHQHITKPVHTHTHTLQIPYVHTTTHYKTHIYTHPHITKQVKTTTLQDTHQIKQSQYNQVSSVEKNWRTRRKISSSTTLSNTSHTDWSRIRPRLPGKKQTTAGDKTQCVQQYLQQSLYRVLNRTVEAIWFLLQALHHILIKYSLLTIFRLYNFEKVLSRSQLLTRANKEHRLAHFLVAVVCSE